MKINKKLRNYLKFQAKTNIFAATTKQSLKDQALEKEKQLLEEDLEDDIKMICRKCQKLKKKGKTFHH